MFDLDGRWVTDVDVFDGHSILDIGLDSVLALSPDELNVERVGYMP